MSGPADNGLSALPGSVEAFVQQQIERIAAPLIIEYTENLHLVGHQGPAARYGLLDLDPGDPLPEALDFLSNMEHDSAQELPFVTLPTGKVAHVHIQPREERYFLILFDATEQHELVQAQQQQANEVRLLNSHQQRTMEQLRAAKSSIEQQRGELEILHQAQTRFIAMMSHEFRTPLNAIMGYAELLSEEGGDSERLGAIRRSAWHLLTMVENVLEQARLGREQVTITREPVPVADLLRLLSDLFQEQAAERGLGLRFSQSPGIPEKLMLDVMRVRQIAINLIGNAIRYTAKGEISVNLNYRDGRLSILVQDSGPGIAPAEQDRIFRPYERGSGSPGGGAGLGLAICRQLAEAMDGSLRLESQLGRGSRFIFTIPAAVPDARPPPQLSGRILVLDDDPDLRQWLKIVLSDWGLEVSMLASLAELQNWREQHPSATDLPDLLLTDYLLEDGVGVEAMKQLRQLDAELPIVMLTGSVPAEEGIRMTHDPNFLLLAKPISAAALRNSLTRMLLPDHQDTP